MNTNVSDPNKFREVCTLAVLVLCLPSPLKMTSFLLHKASVPMIFYGLIYISFKKSESIELAQFELSDCICRLGYSCQTS